MPRCVDDLLLHEGYRFEFFQAVRLMQRFAAERDGSAGPRGRPVGHDLAPKHEAVRLRTAVWHRFPSSQVCEVRALPAPGARPGKGDRPGDPARREMTTAFMGLFGPSGTLPQHYTSLLIERVRQRDYALRDFLDLVNHRVLSLFYRAWEKYRFAVAYERLRSEDAAGEDPFTWCLYCLVGLGTPGLRRRMLFDDEAFLYYAGHFSHRPRSALALESILIDYFELPVSVHQFQGQWLRLSRDDQTSLPCAAWPRGLNTALGTAVVIGERVWDVESKFRVRLGPLGYADFCRLLPSGTMLDTLCQMIRSHAGPQFDFDVQPVLRAADVPWCRLGGEGPDAARLGWNTWIRNQSFRHDVSDAVFSREGLPWTTQT